MEAFFSPERLRGSNQYHCDGCGSKKEAGRWLRGRCTSFHRGTVEAKLARKRRVFVMEGNRGTGLYFAAGFVFSFFLLRTS